MSRGTKSRRKVRKLSPSARNNIGFPTQRKFPTTRTKRGVTPTSKLAYRTTVVWVGLSADLLTPTKISSLVKQVADRSRAHLRRGGRVSARLVTMFAMLRSQHTHINENGDVEIVEQSGYEDGLPDVGSSWEWRSHFHGYLTRSIYDLRDMVRELLYQAKYSSQDARFTFVDSIEITKWS